MDRSLASRSQKVVNCVADDVLAHRNDLVSMSCVDPQWIIYNTDASVYAIVDRLRAAKASGMSQAAFDRLEQVHGVVYDESTLLFDDELRHIVKPVTHCIRDHMHCLVSNGIVGTEIALLLHELADCNVTHDHIVRYADTFRMPKTRGAKPDKRWFSEPGEKNMRAFASEQLNMVPIMMCFLVDMMLPRGLLLDHVKCFLWLERIVALVSLGPDGAVPTCIGLDLRFSSMPVCTSSCMGTYSGRNSTTYTIYLIMWSFYKSS